MRSSFIPHSERQVKDPRAGTEPLAAKCATAVWVLISTKIGTILRANKYEHTVATRLAKCLSKAVDPSERPPKTV